MDIEFDRELVLTYTMELFEKDTLIAVLTRLRYKPYRKGSENNGRGALSLELYR
jgi:hypothetical protein